MNPTWNKKCIRIYLLGVQHLYQNFEVVKREKVARDKLLISFEKPSKESENDSTLLFNKESSHF
jgi:hypothetical protein